MSCSAANNLLPAEPPNKLSQVLSLVPYMVENEAVSESSGYENLEEVFHQVGELRHMTKAERSSLLDEASISKFRELYASHDILIDYYSLSALHQVAALYGAEAKVIGGPVYRALESAESI